MSSVGPEKVLSALSGFSTASGGIPSAQATVIAAVLATAAAILGGIYATRSRGPQAMEAYNGLIQQLQERVAVLEGHSRSLETRVLHLERENSLYKSLYGPLPGAKEGTGQ